MLFYLHERITTLGRGLVRSSVYRSVRDNLISIYEGRGRLRPLGAFSALVLVFFPFSISLASSPPVFDAGSYANAGPATTVTATHTVGTGNNRILFATALDDSSDSITGITYNGVSMTQVAKLNYGGGGKYIYVYCMVNPPSGAHSLTATFSVSTYIDVSGLSFSNAAQTCIPDAQSTKSGNSVGTTITDSVTTVSDNDMAVLVARNDGGAYTAGTNSTANPAGISGYTASFYSTTAKTPPGTMSMAWSYSSGATNYGDIMVAFSPAATTPVSIPWIISSWIHWIY